MTWDTFLEVEEFVASVVDSQETVRLAAAAMASHSRGFVRMIVVAVVVAVVKDTMVQHQGMPHDIAEPSTVFHRNQLVRWGVEILDTQHLDGLPESTPLLPTSSLRIPWKQKQQQAPKPHHRKDHLPANPLLWP